VNEVTHEPLPHAKVTLAATSGKSSSYTTLTDNAGVFWIDRIPPGTYQAMVDRAGFLHAAHLSGSPRQLPALVVLKSEHELRDIVLEATPGAVITGRVLDQDGDPAPEVHVQAMQSRSALGKRQLQIVAMSNTNDLGEYRLYGLSHGQYYVSATRNFGEANAPERSATTFFPNAVDFSAATPIAVNDATQIGGIDVTSIVPTLVDVRGTVSCSSAPVRRDTVVALKRQGADADLAITSTAGIDAEGHFRFRAVPPGAYSLSAFFVDEHGRYGGTQTFEVRNTELDNIEVPLNKALSMSGRIQIEGSGENLNFAAVRVLLEPESDFLAGALVRDIKPDGSFAINDVLPSEYTLSIIGLPSAYYVKKVQVGMQEIAGRKLDFSHTGGALDIVISSSGGTISGAILDNQQQPAPGVSVALVPDPPRPDTPDLYKVLRTNAQGQFSILGVAPGHYQLFAIQGAQSNSYFDSDWVNSLQDYSKQISIDENSTITLTISADSVVPGAVQ
jgi:protocatechuate 3,4-dioxygenase beta subunit